MTDLPEDWHEAGGERSETSYTRRFYEDEGATPGTEETEVEIDVYWDWGGDGHHICAYKHRRLENGDPEEIGLIKSRTADSEEEAVAVAIEFMRELGD